MLVGKTNPVGRLLANQDSEGYLDLLLVFSGSRTAIKEISIPDIFQPPSGPWHIKGQISRLSSKEVITKQAQIFTKFSWTTTATTLDMAVRMISTASILRAVQS